MLNLMKSQSKKKKEEEMDKKHAQNDRRLDIHTKW